MKKLPSKVAYFSRIDLFCSNGQTAKKQKSFTTRAGYLDWGQWQDFKQGNQFTVMPEGEKIWGGQL